MHKLYAIAAMIGCASCGLAQELFDSPEAAAKAIVEEPATTILHGLRRSSAHSREVFSHRATTRSDRAEQTEFARLARARQRIEISPMNPKRAILAIGDEDWPFPVPLHRKNGKWSFDAAQAPAEMRARRIGANELDAIEICHGYVDAQRKYASEDHGDRGMLEYSLRLMSEPGRQNGLYWGRLSQPLIPEGLARAEWRGPLKGEVQPYHGYYFRVLDGQGPNAPGGAHKYLAKGKMIGGIGLVAWPAEYDVTGIHTFIVNQDGVVYEKDITPLPGKPAAPITRFDPDHSWEPVD